MYRMPSLLNRTLNRFIFCLRVVFLMLLIGCAAAANPDQAVEIVDDFHAKLVDVMQNADRLGYQGRFDALKPVISSHFDTPLIAEVILGRYWNDLDDSQKQKFIRLFEKLSIATYANRFDSYDGESFRHVGTEPLNKGRLLVKTELQKSNGETVRLDYLMQHRRDKWYIISVVAQGVNDLSLKRAEYTAIVKNKGFGGLVDNLRNKIAELE